MHVAGLHDKEPRLKAKCHRKKTEIVNLMDVDHKWVPKTQAAELLF